jgi:UDP-glucose 4-epimerase
LTVNLGTGRGISVLELVRAFERASGRAIPYEIASRRPGDVAEVYADPTLAWQLLGWRAQLDLDAMCRDAWLWQSMNPDGYRAAARKPVEAVSRPAAAVLNAAMTVTQPQAWR